VRLDRGALSKSSAVVSLTEDFCRLLGSEGWPRPAQVAVIPDAFDERQMVPGDRGAARRRLGLDPAARLVVYAGMTFSHRGIDRLLQAVRRGPARASRGEAGTARRTAGRDRRPDEAGETLALGSSVSWKGQLPQAEILPYLHAADALVIPDTVTDVTASPFEAVRVPRRGPRRRAPGHSGTARDPSDLDRLLLSPRRCPGRWRGPSSPRSADPGRVQREKAGRDVVLAHTYAARAERILDLAARTQARR
jgi:hypothetical protein